MTRKQKGFVKDYVETENGTQSALKNYNTTDYKTASVIAAENLDKPSIQVAIEIEKETLKSALINKGITPTYLADKVNILLNAVDDKGKTDYTAVDKGLKHATNIYGVESIEDKPKVNTTYNFIFNGDTQEKIRAINDSIKQKLLQNEPDKKN